MPKVQLTAAQEGLRAIGSPPALEVEQTVDRKALLGGLPQGNQWTHERSGGQRVVVDPLVVGEEGGRERSLVFEDGEPVRDTRDRSLLPRAHVRVRLAFLLVRRNDFEPIPLHRASGQV